MSPPPRQLAPRRIFVLEERRLPPCPSRERKWDGDNDQIFDLNQRHAEERAEEWANVDYEKDTEIEVRVVEYRRVRIVTKSVTRTVPRKPE